MDNNFEEFISAVVNFLLCFIPIVVLIAAGAGIGFFVYRSRKQRVEHLQQVLRAVSNIVLPGTATVAQAGSNVATPLTSVLVDGARLLQDLTRGDAAPLEKRALNRIVQSLQSYKQRAMYGEMPEAELNEWRRGEVQRVDSLVAAITAFVSAAERGDATAARQSLYGLDTMLADVYNKHVAFNQGLVDRGVTFPLAPPAPVAVQPLPNSQLVSAQIIQQLPDDKKMLFMMQYNGVQKNPTTAVLLAVFLGGVGAHKFYLGQVGWGIVYILFSWTYIPLVLGIIEAFLVSNQVHRYNAQKALEIAAMLK